MHIMKKVVLFVVGTAIFYFISVLTLFILTVLFSKTSIHIWLSAIHVTAIAELLLLALYLWNKHKKA